MWRQEAVVLGSARWSGISAHSHPHSAQLCSSHLSANGNESYAYAYGFVARQFFFFFKAQKGANLDKTPIKYRLNNIYTLWIKIIITIPTIILISIYFFLLLLYYRGCFLGLWVRITMWEMTPLVGDTWPLALSSLGGITTGAALWQISSEWQRLIAPLCAFSPPSRIVMLQPVASRSFLRDFGL